MQLKCILFDLDGTLLDTSYDFSYALNQTCSDFKQPRLNYQDVRKTVSQGGLAMTKLAFPELDEEELETRRQHFLKIYFENIDRHTRLFPGLEAGMRALAKAEIPWGIITNKPTWLTERLLESIEFPSAPKTIVCGDTLAVRKPDPQPMWLAAETCGFSPEECLYIGDHPRDIEAGINAKMHTAAAWYGYLPESAGESDWPADLHFGTPYELSRFLIKLAEQ
ncbi:MULTISPECIES: HAD family hydrolase [Thiomicrorhabdus]|uniref:HAD-IA family hydrolase n=1 Tax=Thiomicrorhabdus heinhorstiae TaxID=2748010 RepID=A0ABS0BSY9_9GAMM|nr:MULTISPECIES: HAD-IA family hydrolase [Thiomicrorhabdus]MBF6056914.1 HAD-IA family hydrolase [Thiomicrorhabdus heinhorstiae]